MADQDVWTVGRLLTWTTGFLQQQGIDGARLEAEVLLAQACGCKRIELYTRFDEPAAEATRTTYRELVKRRAAGTPVAYLVGRREFYSLNFRVTPDVLIPRPETEFVVVTLLDRVKERSTDEPLAIADIGTGSGILAICAAKYVRRSEVVAVDISPAALAVAQENAAEHGVAERIRFLASDLFAAVPPGETFDFIVSNPPYLGEHELAGLARDVRDHEPRAALVAGPKGTEVIARLVAQSAQRLRPGGWLIVEVSPIIAAAVHHLFDAASGFRLGPVTKDLQGHARVVQAQRTAE